MATQLRPTTRALLPDNEKTTTAGGGNDGGKERGLGGRRRPCFLLRSLIIPEYRHSLTPRPSVRCVRLRQFRGRSRPSVSRSVPIDALRETESVAVVGSGRLFRAASEREVAGAAEGVEGRGREGAPNGLRTRSVSRKQARARRGKLSRYTCY